MTAVSPRFAFTIAEAADEGLIAAKRIGRNPDGSLWKSHYDRATWWRFALADCASIEAMAARLRSLGGATAKVHRHGRAGRRSRPDAVHRRRWADPKDATLRAVERRWIVLDCDDVIVPAGLGRAERLADAALYVRDRLLPPEFRDARLIAIPSASTGLQGDAIARLKLFVPLDRAWPLATLKDWVTGRASATRCRWTPRSSRQGNPSTPHARVHGHGRSGSRLVSRDHPAGKRRRGVAGRGSVRGEGNHDSRTGEGRRRPYAVGTGSNCWR